MTEERRAERGVGAAARSGERPTALRPVGADDDEIAVEIGEPESANPAPPAPSPPLPPRPSAVPPSRAGSTDVGEPGTGRRPRGRMTLRIPDDEVSRPSSPPDAAPEPVATSAPSSVVNAPPIAAQRIISIDSVPGMPVAPLPPPPEPPDFAITGELAGGVPHGVAPPAEDTVRTLPRLSDTWSAAPTARTLPDGTPAAFGAEPPSDGALPSARAEMSSAPDIPIVTDDYPPPADSDARLSEPGDSHEVSPEDVVSVESVRPVGSAVLRSAKAPASAPAIPAAAPAPQPASPATRSPLVILPAPSPLAPPPMNEAAAARKRARPWWEDLFNDDFIRTMAKISDAQIATEVDFIEDSLGVAKGAMLLDLACGTGRHSIELTRRGYQVVGFDLSLAMLARAADEAEERSQKLNFVQGDMRDMTFEDTFDGIFAWNTSFGFFEEEKNAQVVTNVRRALKSGGQFVLDVINRDFLARQTPSLAWFEGEGCVCMDEMHIDWITSRMRVKRTMMMDDGRTKEIEYSIRVYSLHELGKLLHDSGFRVAEVSGRIATPGVFLGSDSPRTIIVAEKR